MAIKVYLLKNSIVNSSLEEYEALRAEWKEKKKLAKLENAEGTGPKQKLKNELRTVFLTTTDTAPEAFSQAGFYYEGDLDIHSIEFCKVEAQRNYLCGNLHIPKLRNPLADKFQLYFFVNRKNILIVDDQGFAEKIINRIIKNRLKPGQSREMFLYTFFTEFMERDLENLGRYSRKIMQIEEDISDEDMDEITEEIAQIRKELLVLREYYDELHDVGKQLEENENNFFSGKNLEYFGIISDRADRLMGRTMYLLDYIGQVREKYQGIVAERQNKNMEFLTIISTIFFPLTLITGWYGMNFGNMPELEHGYPGVIGLSLAVIAIIIWIFKKRKIL